ncbi:MAG: DUF4339 domain-containing protein, partial [Acidobacteria bacterium]|nr:DUF4339 domain-containing protein [Acidobacteriota bacterium]
MSQWYYISNNQKLGPISDIDLKRLADQGQIRPGDMILKEGRLKWVPSQTIKGLFTRSKIRTQASHTGHTGKAVPPLTEAGHVRRKWGFARQCLAILLVSLIPAAAVGSWFVLQINELKTTFASEVEAARKANVTLQELNPISQTAEHIANSQDPRLRGLELALAEVQEQVRNGTSDVPPLKLQITKIQHTLAENADAIAALRLELSKRISELEIQRNKSARQSPDNDKKDQAESTPRSSENLDQGPYSLIDRHALNASADAERDLKSLARYLTSRAQNETEKV